jgi:hypothetical protein
MNIAENTFPIYALTEKNLHWYIAGFLKAKDVLRLSSVSSRCWQAYFPIYERLIGRTDKTLDALQELTRDFKFFSNNSCYDILERVLRALSRLSIAPPSPPQNMSESKYEAAQSLGLTASDCEKMEADTLALLLRKKQFDIITYRIVTFWNDKLMIDFLKRCFKDVTDFDNLTPPQLERARLIASIPNKKPTLPAVYIHPLVVFITRISMYREDFFKKRTPHILQP